MAIAAIVTKFRGLFSKGAQAVEHVRIPEHVRVPKLVEELERTPAADCFVTRPRELTAKLPSTNGVTIREAVSDIDLKEIHRIEVAAKASIDPVPTKFVEYETSLDDLKSYIVRDEKKKVIGYYQTEPVQNSSLYISSIGVPKKLRGTKSSYRALMAIKEDVTKLAEQCGANTVSLHVDSQNEPLVRLYKRFGFEVKMTEPNYYENGNTAHYMEALVKKPVNDNAPARLVEADLLEAPSHVESAITHTDAATVEKATEAIDETAFKSELTEKLSQLQAVDGYGMPVMGSGVVAKIVESAKTPEQAIAKFDLTKKLIQLTDNLGGSFFDSGNVARIVSPVKTAEQGELVYELAENLHKLKAKEGYWVYNSAAMERMLADVKTTAQVKSRIEIAQKIAYLADIEDKYGVRSVNSTLLAEIINSAESVGEGNFKIKFVEKMAKDLDVGPQSIEEIFKVVKTPEQANLAVGLIGLRAKEGWRRLSDKAVMRAVSVTRTTEQAAKKMELATNKEFLAKVDSLDSEFGKKLYTGVLETNREVDVDRMIKLYDYLKENKINLQQFGENRITTEHIAELFDDSMFRTCDLLDDSTIKYATKLKYDKFKYFIQRVEALQCGIYGQNYSKLKERLAKYTSPELKLDRVQSILALANSKSYPSPVLEAIELLKSPRATVEQVNRASEIFTSARPYQEQVAEFFEQFVIPADRQAELSKFFDKHNAVLSPKSQNSVKNHLAVIDKKIQSIQKNTAIPEAVRTAKVAELEAQKAELTSTGDVSKAAKMSDIGLKMLAQQIENHVNIPRLNAEFNGFISAQVYKKLGMEPTPELLKALNFDRDYLSNLFTALSNEAFATEFKSLVQLVKDNPSKPLSEIREILAHNQETKKLFEEYGINYKKWTKTDNALSHNFSFEVNVEEATRGVERNILSEINGGLFHYVKGTDKILTALENAGYKIGATEITKNGAAVTKNDLEKIVDIFKDTINANPEFWDKPLADVHAEREKNELMDHLLKGRRKEVSDLSNMTDVNMDLTVRLADVDDIGRNLFLGNHVGCCTSVEGANNFAAPQHLKNSFIRAMEIVDKSGTSYGNSMCYFAKVDGKLSFIIDSFEVNGKIGGNQKVTDAIIAYAKQITAEMGHPDATIYFGPNYNKIKMDKLELTKNHTVEIIGKVDNETYIDAIGGNADVNAAHAERELYQLAA